MERKRIKKKILKQKFKKKTKFSAFFGLFQTVTLFFWKISPRVL